MEKTFQKEEGISLLDIIRLLLSKIKLLILVVLGGAVLGGAYAVVTTMNVNYYGTSVEFYVNPESPDDANLGLNNSQYGVYGAYGRHVMDNIVKLLNSESFTEQLIINYDQNIGADGLWATDTESGLPLKLAVLPKKNISPDLDGLIDKAQAKIDESETVAADANAIIEEAAEVYTTLQEEWAKAVFDTAYNSTYSKDKYDKVLEKDPAFFDDYPELVKAYEKYEGTDGNPGLKAQAEEKKAQAKAMAAEAEALTKNTLDVWGKTADYKAKLSKFHDIIHFSYLQENEDADDANNLARSFIYTKISVLNDEKFAKELLEVVKEVVPAYVEANMTVPTGYEGTNCQRTTRSDDIELTNAGYTMNQAIKYAVLLAAAAGVIACVIIIIIDKSDKRLRDYEVITKEFNVPILGVVPTIDMNPVNAPKKKATKENTEVK